MTSVTTRLFAALLPLFVAVFPIAAAAEAGHSTLDPETGRFVALPGEGGSPFDAASSCSVSRPGAPAFPGPQCFPSTCCPEDRPILGCNPYPPNCAGRVCRGTQPDPVDPACSARCAPPASGAEPVQCTVTAWFSDVGVPKVQRGATDCEAIRAVCLIVKREHGVEPRKLDNLRCERLNAAPAPRK